MSVSVREVLYLGPEDGVKHVCSMLTNQFRVGRAQNEAEVDRLLPNADAILDASMQVVFTRERIESGARLKLFVAASTGTDHVDVSALERRNVPLVSLRNGPEVLRNLNAAAEHSWLLVLACARNLPAAIRGPLHGEWNRNAYPGLMLRGKIMGLLGCGRIGQWMARYAAAFGMTCLGFDPHVKPWPAGIERVNLDTLFERSHVLSIHVPLTTETRGMVGARELAKIRRGAILVNTSRGDVVDEAALIEALQAGRVSSAGLDVLSGEPAVNNNPLLHYAVQHENVIITPHIGGYCPEALQIALVFACGRINEFFDR